jgi:hypothetical protein
MVPPHRWRLDVRAIEPVRVIVIDAFALRKICEQEHEIGLPEKSAGTSQSGRRRCKFFAITTGRGPGKPVEA